MSNIKVFQVNDHDISQIQLDLSSIDEDGYILLILRNKIYNYLESINVITAELEKTHDVSIQMSKTKIPFVSVKDYYENKIDLNGNYYFKLVLTKKFIPFKIKSGYQSHIDVETENGKCVLRSGNRKYVGEIDFDKMVPHGFGIETINNVYSYIGDWCYGNKQGKGKIIKKFKNWTYTYQGDFFDNQYNGEGKEVLGNNIIYEGIYENGNIVRGTITLPSNIIFSGSIVDGKPSGYGTETIIGESIYEGEWKNGVKHGFGTIKYDQGTIVEGNFINGKLNSGQIKSHHGLLYNGELVNYFPHGYGVEKYPDGSFYEGEFINGVRHGKGKFTFANKKVVNVEYINGYEKTLYDNIKSKL
jgi:hypothetical protein